MFGIGRAVKKRWRGTNVVSDAAPDMANSPADTNNEHQPPSPPSEDHGALLLSEPDQFLGTLVHAINDVLLGKRSPDSYDVLHMAQLVSSMDSAQYLMENMLTATNIENDLDLLSHAMTKRGDDGLILEFGVASGRTINHLASLTDQKVYGFDVFFRITGRLADWF